MADDSTGDAVTVTGAVVEGQLETLLAVVLLLLLSLRTLSWKNVHRRWLFDMKVVVVVGVVLGRMIPVALVVSVPVVFVIAAVRHKYFDE
jgi:hypothetical protein